MKMVFPYLVAACSLIPIATNDVAPSKIVCETSAAIPPPEPVNPGELVIMIDKHVATLALVYENTGDTLKCYYGLRTGLNPGPKERAGDRKTPEGEYEVAADWKHSSYYRWLAINYPNEADRAAGRTGGLIGIHWLDPDVHRAANPTGSLGCITLPDKALIDEIAEHVRVGTRVVIR